MQKVTVTILTTQRVEGQAEQMKLCVQGQLTVTPHTYVLQYETPTDEGEATQTTLTVDKDGSRAVMVNQGTITIQPNQRHTAPYRMGPYELELGVQGKTVDCRLTPLGGRLTLAYDLFINQMPASENTVELFVQP